MKEGGVPLAFQPCNLFAFSLKVSKVPSPRKIAVVTSIHKSGLKDLPEKYRANNVSSSCFRVLERIVKNKLMDFTKANNLISETQHGFMRGRPTDTLFVTSYDVVTHNLDNNKIVDIFLVDIFFDLPKAFDEVLYWGFGTTFV